MAGTTPLGVEDVLTAAQLREVVQKCVGATGRWRLLGAALRPAAAGVAGFLGDHFRLALTVVVDDRVLKIPLFVKCLPLTNLPKAEFIASNNIFKREHVMFKLMEELETGGSNPWHAQAYLYSDTLLVTGDMAAQGYRNCDQLQPFDLGHVRAALATVARFHAATANHEARQRRALGRPYRLVEEFGEAIAEAIYKDAPWMRAAAKLTANFIQEFSDKYKTTPDLEPKILKQYLEGCADLTEAKESFNVALHKDLWGNNIMFKYEDGVPTNAVLVDFQCIRYASPAFDVMLFWYVTTSRSFRNQHEDEILRHYFTVFMDSVDENTKLRLRGLCYDYEEFLRWVARSRRFGVLAASVLYPYALLDQASARELFDDPATFEQRFNVDRSAPVLAHARCQPAYLHRLLEVGEEFVERFLLA